MFDIIFNSMGFAGTFKNLLGVQNATILMFLSLIILLMMGMRLAHLTGLVAMVFAYGWFGPKVFGVLTSNLYGFVAKNEALMAVPMFVLMAAFLDKTGIARDLYNAMQYSVGKIKGGVAVQTMIVAVILAASSGIIGGETVLLGLLALPQMLRLGYDKQMSIGTVCAGGSLGTMVPPSIVLIIYGMVANVSIGHLFTGSILPALMLASMYIMYILVRCHINPTLAGEGVEADKSIFQRLLPLFGLLVKVFIVIAVVVAFYFAVNFILGRIFLSQESLSFYSKLLTTLFVMALIISKIIHTSRTLEKGKRGAFIFHMLSPTLIIGAVLGSIYGGIASVTESASMGVIAVIILAAIRGELRIDVFKHSIHQTMRTCGMIIWIGISAAMLIGVYNLMGGAKFVNDLILGLDVPSLVIILVMMGILMFLGMFMDWIGVAMLTMPIFVPIIVGLGYNPVWFGVLFCMNMQVSFLSPPFGPAAFYLKSVAPPEVSLVDIYKSVWPFIIMQIIGILILILYPNLALILVK